MAFKIVGTYSPSGSAMVSLIAQLSEEPFSFSLGCLIPPMLCILSTAVIKQVDCDSYFPSPCLHRLVGLQRQPHPRSCGVKANNAGWIAFNLLQMLCNRRDQKSRTGMPTLSSCSQLGTFCGQTSTSLETSGRTQCFGSIRRPKWNPDPILIAHMSVSHLMAAAYILRDLQGAWRFWK